MRQWLITILRPVVAAAALASVAHAGVVTCTNDFDLIPANTYMVAGRITMSSSYATGGDTFSAANTLSDAGACLCHSNARKPLVVIVEGEKGDFLFEYDRTNLKIKAKAPVFVFGSGAGNALLSPAPVGGTSTLAVAQATGNYVVSAGEVPATVNLSAITLNFIALCS